MNHRPHAREAVVQACAAAALLLSGMADAPAEEPAVDAMLGGFEFAPYQGGNILPEQIPRADWQGYHLVDTRSAADFARGHIPGAINIEWRQVLARRDELSEERPLLLYCNTGSLSAQAAFALKVAGREDVYILTGGFDGWNAKGGFDAYERVAGGSGR